MDNKLKILLVSPYLPSNDTVGCARKIYDFIRLANQRGHAVYLLSFCSQEDRKRVALISPYCSKIYLEYLKDYRRYPDKSLYFKKTIEEFSRKESPDILQCENSYLRRYLPLGVEVPSVLVEHEVLSVSFWEKARFTSNYIKKLILCVRAVKKTFEEKKWYSKFNRIIVFSEADKKAISSRYKLKNIDIIALGIDLKKYLPPPESKKSHDLIFVGNFSHAPNEDAVLYFCAEVLPLIKKKFPDTTFLIVGANPSLTIKNLSRRNKNITVTGYAEDLRGFYAKSKVFVAPIRYGTGMCFKILEALALEVPVVATLIGSRGIDFKDAIKIASGNREFADAVIELLGISTKRQELATRGREVVRRHYDWDKLLTKYESVYYNLLGNKFKLWD